MIIPSEKFYFNKIIKENFHIIRQEGIALLNANAFCHHTQSAENLNSKKYKIANKWMECILEQRKKDDTISANNRCMAKKTWEIISSIQEIMSCDDSKVYFSLLPPHSFVSMHTNGLKLNTRHRHQLCLIMPKLNQNEEVSITIGSTKYFWQEGEILTFDDAIIHSVINNSNWSRLVLIYDSLPLIDN